MKKINQHIEIVSSTVAGLSSMGKSPREAIQRALRKHYTKVGISIVNNHLDLEELLAKKPDVVFLGMKYIPEHLDGDKSSANKIWLSNYLAEQGITSTGSDSLSHQLELNKPFAKQRVIDAGLATSPYHVATEVMKLKRSEVLFNFPMFVKPTNLGGGQGVDANSVVHTFTQLSNKVESITDEIQSDALIEQYLSGREFSVAILKDDLNSNFYIMPIELVAPQDIHGSRLLSNVIKSADAEKASAITDLELKKAICDLAIKVFHALGARDYGRIDIRLDDDGKPHFLEANLIPSLMDNYGSFPKACKINADLEYEDMLIKIVRLAFNRSFTEDNGTSLLSSKNNSLSTNLKPLFSV